MQRVVTKSSAVFQRPISQSHQGIAEAMAPAIHDLISRAMREIKKNDEVTLKRFWSKVEDSPDSLSGKFFIKLLANMFYRVPILTRVGVDQIPSSRRLISLLTNVYEARFESALTYLVVNRPDVMVIFKRNQEASGMEVTAFLRAILLEYAYGK
jgi:hypothetical protein